MKPAIESAAYSLWVSLLTGTKSQKEVLSDLLEVLAGLKNVEDLDGE